MRGNRLKTSDLLRFNHLRHEVSVRTTLMSFILRAQTKNTFLTQKNSQDLLAIPTHALKLPAAQR